jgi:hypothetical protein
MKVIFALFFLFLSGCAQQPLVKQTMSGYPEGVFKNMSVEAAKSRIIDGCTQRGIFVQEANSNQVVCSKSLEGGDAVLAQFLIGNSYSTRPDVKIRFVIYQIGQDTKVSAQQWVETQMAFGQMRRIELNENNQKNDMQQFLFTLGAR